MFKKVLEYAGDYRKVTYSAIFWMVSGVIMSVLPFIFIYQLILPLLGYGENSTSQIVFKLIAIGVCGILHAVFYTHGLALSHKSAYNTLLNIRISLQKKLEKHPLGVIQEKGTGSIRQMFIDDIESIEIILAHAIPEGVSNIAIPVITYLSILMIDWKLGLLSLCSLPIGFIAMKIMYSKGKKIMTNYYKAAHKMNNTIVEFVNGMEVVKVFNKGGDSYHQFEEDVTKYRDYTLDWYKACRPWSSIYCSVVPCVAGVTLPLGSWFVLNGYSTLPHLVLVICMSFGIGPAIIKILTFIGKVPTIKYKIERLEKLMSAPPLKQSDRSFQGKDHSITFKDVSFSYEDGDDVLRKIFLKAEDRKFTALVGESGSGKSTLAKLMVHFYDVNSGSVSIGRQNIEDMSIEALNNEISYVSQEQFLFNMSLLENIRIGKPDATDEEVLEAAEKAQCNEFLNKLEHGIYTMAGDGGKQLSGGERQRISLARAILKNAPIVVLDEATAFMDPENEEKMNRAISEVIADKTVIVIAHRLYTIADFDKICVIDNGQLVAEGTHDELMKKCTKYKKLWNASIGSEDWMVSSGEKEEVR